MMNEKCAACIHCEVCGFIESEVARDGACDFYEDGKRWTSVSEKLPKPKETENLIAKYYLVQNEYGDMLVARWDGKGWEQMYQHEYLEDDVVAWMPLPEGCKAGKEGEG